MNTMKKVKAQRLVNVCQNVFRESITELQVMKDAYLAGNLQAAKARKRYHVIMKRVVFYNHIQFAICCKYMDVQKEYDVTSFNDFINFFEC